MLQRAVTKLQRQQFTPKQIAENKPKAFSIGALDKKAVSRTEEERRKKKDEEEAIKSVSMLTINLAQKLLRLG